jgi:hypothetical protein
MKTSSGELLRRTRVPFLQPMTLVVSTLGKKYAFMWIDLSLYTRILGFIVRSMSHELECYNSNATIWLRLRPSCTTRLLTLLLLLLLPTILHAQFSYTTTNGTITITKFVDHFGIENVFAIPSAINGLPVTSLGDSAFEKCNYLYSVIIPNSITSIGSSAFWNCATLTSVTIPNSVTNIGKSPFAGCKSLSNITVDALNPAYSSSNGVLFNKSQTILIQCPENKSGKYAIPDTVTRIGSGAFSRCFNLSSVTIPDSVTRIESYAFDNCLNLASAVIPNSVATIEYRAFGSCLGLSSVKIPNNVTNIGSRAFDGCSRLIIATIGNSVASVGSGTFSMCASLSSITVGSSVTNIDSSAFSGCSSLTNITVDVLNPVYSSLEGVLFNKSQTTLITCPMGVVGSYTLPDSVNHVDIEAFYQCANITAIAVTAQNIQYTSVNGVLFDKNQTTLVRYPPGKVGSYMFPNNTINIGSQAFSQCNRLTSVTIPNSVANIASKAFADCSELTSVFFKGKAPNVSINAFESANNATVYRLSGTTGWDSNLAGRPTAFWDLAMPYNYTINSGAITIME